MKLTRTVAVALLLTLASLCFAKPPFLKLFLSTYNIQPGSKLGQARCIICHEPPGPPKRNPYGKQVQAALEAAHARFVTVEMLRSIEKKNVGDGVTNITKIKGDKLPGVLQPKAKKPSKHQKSGSRTKKRAEPTDIPASVILLTSTPLALLSWRGRSKQR